MSIFKTCQCKPTSVHMNGLEKIVELRGGLAALKIFGRLHRMIIWCVLL